jgi:hypothetical protein
MSKAPKAPNPVAVSNAQTASNVATAEAQAKLNALDQFGPYGSVTFNRDAKGLPTGQTITLDPQVKALLDSQMASQQGISDAVSGAIGRLPGQAFDPSSVPDTGQIAQTAYDRQLGLLKPEFDEQAKALEVKLSERGIPIGSEVWNDEMNRFERAKGNALTTAAQSADLAALNEQQRLLTNAERQYAMPYDQLASLMGVSQPAQTPSFAPQTPTSVANTDVSGNIWNAYQAKANQAAATNQALGGIGGALIMAMPKIPSDERLKENRVPADGEAVLGDLRALPVDHYDYKPEARAAMNLPESRTGPMAQDWAARFGGDGATIDMGDMMGKMLAAIKALDARDRAIAQGGGGFMGLGAIRDRMAA